MFSGLGKLGHGTSSRSSKRTSSTMAKAGLKTSATALALTLEVICAANAVDIDWMVVCVRSELVYTVTAFYDTASTWVDLVKKKKVSLCKLELARMVRMFPSSPSPLQ